MNTPFEPTRVRALLFDLGGVLFDFDFAHALDHWAPLSMLSREALGGAFVFDEAYQRHERGEISAEQYFDSLRQSLQLAASDTQMAAGWNAIFRAEITPTLDAVQAARARFPCYAFTNTNATHHATWRAAYPQVEASFDRVFASSEIGLRKPERAAFTHVCAAIGKAPAEVLFFDDLLENAQGAIAVGMQAVQVRSPEDVRAALRQLGVDVPASR